VRQQRDPIAGPKPVVVQPGRCAVHQLIELSERQFDVAVDDRDLVGLPTGRPAGNVAETVLSGPRDQCIGAGLRVLHALEGIRVSAVGWLVSHSVDSAVPEMSVHSDTHSHEYRFIAWGCVDSHHRP